MPPTNGSQNASQASQLLQGFNTMQMQMGLMPGGSPPPPPMMPMPMPPHPGQVAGMLAQQSMQMQYVSPHPSQVFGGHSMGFPSAFGSPMPPPLMGRSAMARQRGIHEAGYPLGMAQAGTGLGLRIGGGMAASAVGSMFGGPIGGMAAGFAFEHLGMGQGLQNMGNALFEPIVKQREQALAFQNASTGFIHGGSQMSMTGQGMNAVGSQQVTRGLNRMADDRGFRRETQGMFNREDLSRITRLSGELGMLDNAQTADQITREVKKVSKALSSFMKLAEEPDVRAAMHQMSRMRSLGFGTSEIPVATANARTFARMAGVSISDVMAGAERGAAIYQQAGLSGASGFQAGIGAQGMARGLASGMDPRRLAMAGGAAGIEQTMLGAGAHAVTMDAMLPGLITRRNGRLMADPDSIREMISGGGGIDGMARRSSENLRRLGPGAMQEIFTQRRELQDDIARQLGPTGTTMLPLLQAQMISRRTGMNIGASLRTLGLGEEQARTLEQAYDSPTFMSDMRRQMEITNRERAVERRDHLRGRNTVRGRMGRMFDSTIRRGANDIADSMTAPIADYFANEQDEEEAAALQGEGPYRIIRRDRGGSAVQAAQTRDRFRRDVPGMRRGMQRMQQELDRSVNQENAVDEGLSRLGVAGLPIRMMHGPGGFGFSTQGRGGNSYRDTVLEGASLGTRVNDILGNGPTSAQVNALGQGQAELTGLIGRTAGMTTEQRRTDRASAFRGVSTSMNSQQRGQMIGTATAAVRDYVNSSRGPFGNTRRSATSGDMRASVQQALVQSGMSESEAQRFVASDAAMGRIIEDSRAGMTDEQREALSNIEEQGNTAREGLLGQSQDNLRELAVTHRENAAEMLGLNTMGNASDRDKAAVYDVIGGEGADADMRRKVYAAMLMQRSSDDATKQQGDALMATLEDQAQRTNKLDQFEAAKASAESQLSSMNETDRQQMADSVSGKTAEQAIALVNAAGAEVTEAGNAAAVAATNDLLGSRAGGTYARLGGGAKAVAELRRNPSQITDRRIRRMFDEGKSDEEIARAIDTSTAARVSSGEGAGSAGAGTSEADRASGETTEAMAAALEEGRRDFPSAVAQFSEASTKLLEAATALQDRGSMSALFSNSANGGSGGGGIFDPLGWIPGM